MKTRMILFSVITLFLLVGGIGCEKEEWKEMSIEYKLCDCNETELASLSFTNKNIDMFKVSSDDAESELLQSSGSAWMIIYNSQTDEANIYILENPIIQICRICNFPDSAKEWDVPPKGVKVYFEGITYTSCNPPGGIGTVSYFDYVFTALKIQTK